MQFVTSSHMHIVHTSMELARKKEQNKNEDKVIAISRLPIKWRMKNWLAFHRSTLAHLFERMCSAQPAIMGACMPHWIEMKKKSFDGFTLVYSSATNCQPIKWRVMQACRHACWLPFIHGCIHRFDKYVLIKNLNAWQTSYTIHFFFIADTMYVQYDTPYVLLDFPHTHERNGVFLCSIHHSWQIIIWNYDKNLCARFTLLADFSQT